MFPLVPKQRERFDGPRSASPGQMKARTSGVFVACNVGPSGTFRFQTSHTSLDRFLGSGVSLPTREIELRADHDRLDPAATVRDVQAIRARVVTLARATPDSLSHCFS